MLIKVKLFGAISPLLQKQEFQLTQGATMGDLVDIIIESTQDADIQLIKSASFIINNENANLDTILKDGDKVIILTTLGGG